MQLHQINFEGTKRFSPLFLDYIRGEKKLSKFHGARPEIESFEATIANRNFEDEKREVLVDVLKSQYENCETRSQVAQNIASLRQPNTFTVTTGHQLNIFTGPLFFVYKIVAAINMARSLKVKYPEYNFVPVYWMATEDHDFEEINNFNLFGKKYSWKSDQKGPVGRFSTESMKILLDEIPEKPELFTKGYLGQKTLADATRDIVNELFGEQGLVILDADDKQLKKALLPVMKADIFHNEAHSLAQAATEELEEMGYKGQIYPRPINFFYMENGLRERIELVDGNYVVLNTSLTFTKGELQQEIDENPEKFSPNVVLRPVYEEIILPNLAYIGGPAEVTYWLQLKGVFEHFKVPFPIVFPRSFAMILTGVIAKKMDKIPLKSMDIFEDYDELKEKILYSNSEPAHDLADQLKDIEKAFKSIQDKANELDPSLEGFVMSEFKKTEKSVDNIQKRLRKAEEQKEATRIKQLESVLDKLFPNGNPQEREDNLLNFYINNPNFINELLAILDPFILKYNLLTEDA